MKVVFVHFGREHLGLEYLSSFLESKGHQVELVCDPGLFSREDNVFYAPFLEKLFRKRNIIKEIVESKPDLIGFSPYTTTFAWACRMAKEVKEFIDVPVIFGGIHTTLVPKQVLENSFVDFVIVGEGEQALLELIQNLNGRTALDKIKNLWFKKKGRIIGNELRPPLKDLDELPLPDKRLFEKQVRFEDDYMIMSSRGCPFNCSYCCESYLNKIYQNSYFRRRNPANVIRELKIMKARYNFREVMFFDSILFTDKDWLKSLLFRYQREIGAPFRCTGYVGLLDYEVARLLKEAGCYGIDFGVQTFNQQIRKKVLNRFETNDQIKKAFKICDRVKLRYDVDLMFGLPEMKLQDYLLTIDFMKGAGSLNRLKCYYLSYFPKTVIVDKAKESDMLGDEDIDDINKGKIGDWFHIDSIKNPRQKRWKDNFSKIYKIYPLLPDWLKKAIVQKRLYGLFCVIPAFLIALLQLWIGIKNKDHRFKIYIYNYLRHFKELLVGP